MPSNDPSPDFPTTPRRRQQGREGDFTLEEKNLSPNRKAITHNFPNTAAIPQISSPSPLVKETEPIYYGEALARNLWLEKQGGRIVGIFMGIFVLVLIIMMMAGQYPGQSDSIKRVYDLFPVIGDLIACAICVHILQRLYNSLQQLQRQQFNQIIQSESLLDVEDTQAALRSAKRAALAWLFLTIGVILYTLGQVIWAAYDVNMPSAKVPFPGLYDIPFVATYPFFLIGTLLLFRRVSEAEVGRVRLLLDALALVGATLALSWFFILEPSIARLYGSPEAKFLTIYFPTGDLLLVAVGAFGLFSPFSSRELEPVYIRLFWGLCIQAFTDSLLAYEILNVDYRTGLLRIVLTPLSTLCIALAAIKYPQLIAEEQEIKANGGQRTSSGNLRRYAGQVKSSLRAIAPFLLALLTCLILISGVAPRGGTILVQASLSAFLLIILVVARQSLTMIENTRLTMQMRGELALSQTELDATRQEIRVVTREAQEKRVLEDGVALLHNAHARVARGEFTTRVNIASGPLMPIAISFNLMVERLGSLRQQTTAYERLRKECQILQQAVGRLAQGKSLANLAQLPQGVTELGSTMLQLVQYQRMQQQQWRSQMQTVDALRNRLRYLRESLLDMGRDTKLNSLERIAYERIFRSTEQLEQQINHLTDQLKRLDTRADKSIDD